MTSLDHAPTTRKRRRVKMTQQSLTRSSLLFLRQLAGHTEQIHCCTFNTRRHHVFTACAKTMRLWTLQRELKRIQIPSKGEGTVPAIFSEVFFFAREELYLVVCGGHPANASSSYAGYVLGFHAGLTPALEFQAHEDASIVAASFSEETGELITCDTRGCVKVWSFRRESDNDKLRIYHRATVETQSGNNPACDMTAVAQSDICVVATQTGKLVVVDLTDVRVLDRYDCLKANSERAESSAQLAKVVFDNDAQHLLVAFSDGTVDLYCFYEPEAETLSTKHVLLYMTTFSCHKGAVRDLCLIEDIEGALTCGEDNIVRHWRPMTSAEVGRYQHVRRPAPPGAVAANTKLETLTTSRLVPVRLEVDAMCSKQLLLVISGELITVLEVLTPCLPFASASGTVLQAQTVLGPSPPVSFDVNLDRWKVKPNRHHISTYSSDEKITIFDAASGKTAFSFPIPKRTQFFELETRNTAQRALKASAAPSPHHIPRLRADPTSAIGRVSCYWWFADLAMHCLGWSDGKVDLRDSNTDLRFELYDNKSLSPIQAMDIIQLAGPHAQKVNEIQQMIRPTSGYIPLRPDSSQAQICKNCDEDAELSLLRHELEASDKSQDPFLDSLTKKHRKLSSPIRSKTPKSSKLKPLSGRSAHALITGNIDGVLHMWNVEETILTKTVKAHSGPIIHISCLDPVEPTKRIKCHEAEFLIERCIVSAGQDSFVKLWSLPNLQLIGHVQTNHLSSLANQSESVEHGLPSQLSALLPLPAFGLFISGHDNGYVQIFPLPHADKTAFVPSQASYSERVHTKRVTTLSQGILDPRILLSASLDHGVMVWHISPHATLIQTRRLNFAAPVQAACFTPICDEIVVTAGAAISLVSYWDKDGSVTVSANNLSVLPSIQAEEQNRAMISEEPYDLELTSTLSDSEASGQNRELVPLSRQDFNERKHQAYQDQTVDMSLYPSLVQVQIEVLRLAFIERAANEQMTLINSENLPLVLSALGWVDVAWSPILSVARRNEIDLQKPFLNLTEVLRFTNQFVTSPEAEILLEPIQARGIANLKRFADEKTSGASNHLEAPQIAQRKLNFQENRTGASHVARKYADMCGTRTIITYNSLGEKNDPNIIYIKDKMSGPGPLRWKVDARVDTHQHESAGSSTVRNLKELPQHFMHLFVSQYGQRAADRLTKLEVRSIPLLSVLRGIRSVVMEKIMLDSHARDEGRRRVSMSRCVMEWHLRRFGTAVKISRVVAERILSFLNALRKYAAEVLPCRTLLCFVLSGPHRRKPTTSNFFTDLVQFLLNHGADYVPHMVVDDQDDPPPTELLLKALHTVVPLQRKLKDANKLRDDLCEAAKIRPHMTQSQILDFLANCYDSWATFAPRRASSPRFSLSDPMSPSEMSSASPISPISEQLGTAIHDIKFPDPQEVLILKPRPLRMLSTFTTILTGDSYDHNKLLQREQTIGSSGMSMTEVLDDFSGTHWISRRRSRYMSAPDLALDASLLPRRVQKRDQVDPLHMQRNDFGRRGKRSVFVQKAKRERRKTLEALQLASGSNRSPISPTGSAYDLGDSDDDTISCESSLSDPNDEPPVWEAGEEGHPDDQELFNNEVPRPGQLTKEEQKALDAAAAAAAAAAASAKGSGRMSMTLNIPGVDGLGGPRGSILVSPDGPGSPSLFDKIMSPPETQTPQSLSLDDQRRASNTQIDKRRQSIRNLKRRASQAGVSAEEMRSLQEAIEAEEAALKYDLERPISRGATLSSSEIMATRRSFRASISLEEQQAFEMKRRMSFNQAKLQEIKEEEKRMTFTQLAKREASAKCIQACARGFLIRSIVSSMATPSLDDHFNSSMQAKTHVSIPNAGELNSEHEQVRVLTAGSSSINMNSFLFQNDTDPLQDDFDNLYGLLESPEGEFVSSAAQGQSTSRGLAELAHRDPKAAMQEIKKNQNTLRQSHGDNDAGDKIKGGSRRASRSLFSGTNSKSSSKALTQGKVDGVEDLNDAGDALKQGELSASARNLLGSLGIQGSKRASLVIGPNGTQLVLESGETVPIDPTQAEELFGENVDEGVIEFGTDDDPFGLNMYEGMEASKLSPGGVGSQEALLLLQNQQVEEEEEKTPPPPPEPALNDDMKAILKANRYLPKEHKRSMATEGTKLKTLSNCFGEQIEFDPLTLMKHLSSVPHWTPSENVDNDEDDWKEIDQLDMRRDQNLAQGNLDFLYADDDQNKAQPLPEASDIHGAQGKKWTEFFKEMEALMQPKSEGMKESELDRQERKLKELKRVMKEEGMIDDDVDDDVSASTSQDNVGEVKSPRPFAERTKHFWKQLQSAIKIGSALRTQRKDHFEKALKGEIHIRDITMGEPTHAAVENGKFSYFRFVVPSADSFLTISIQSDDGDPDLFLSNEAVPTIKDHKWRTSAIGNLRIVLPPGSSGYHAGVYIAGVYSLTPSKFSLLAELQNNDYGCEELDHVSSLTRKFNIIAVNPHRQTVEEVNQRLAEEALTEEAELAEQQLAARVAAGKGSVPAHTPENSAPESSQRKEKTSAGKGKHDQLQRRATYPSGNGSLTFKEMQEPGTGAMDDIFTGYENRRDDEFEVKLVEVGRSTVCREQFLAVVGEEEEVEESLFKQRSRLSSNDPEKQDKTLSTFCDNDSDAASISTWGGESLASELVPPKKTRLLKHLLVFPKPVQYDLRNFHGAREQNQRSALLGQLEALEPKARCKAAFRMFKQSHSLSQAIVDGARYDVASEDLVRWLQDMNVDETDSSLSLDYNYFEKVVLDIGTRVIQAKRAKMEEKLGSMRDLDSQLLFPKSKSAVALGVGPRVGLDIAHLPNPKHPDYELPDLAKIFAKNDRELDAAQRRANKRAVNHIRRKRREKILRDKLGDQAVAEMQKMGGW